MRTEMDPVMPQAATPLVEPQGVLLLHSSPCVFLASELWWLHSCERVFGTSQLFQVVVISGFSTGWLTSAVGWIAVNFGRCKKVKSYKFASSAQIGSKWCMQTM